jgi:hypothetical protein
MIYDFNILFKFSAGNFQTHRINVYTQLWRCQLKTFQIKMSSESQQQWYRMHNNEMWERVTKSTAYVRHNHHHRQLLDHNENINNVLGWIIIKLCLFIVYYECAVCFMGFTSDVVVVSGVVFFTSVLDFNSWSSRRWEIESFNYCIQTHTHTHILMCVRAEMEWKLKSEIFLRAI